MSYVQYETVDFNNVRDTIATQNHFQKPGLKLGEQVWQTSVASFF